MDIGDSSSDRILDRNHAEFSGPISDCRQRILECCAGQGFTFGIDVAAGDMGIGAWLALVGDFVDGHSFLKPDTASTTSGKVTVQDRVTRLRRRATAPARNEARNSAPLTVNAATRI